MLCPIIKNLAVKYISKYINMSIIKFNTIYIPYKSKIIFYLSSK